MNSGSAKLFLLLFVLLSSPIFVNSEEIIKPCNVRRLSGSLDLVPVFNSNNPEIVQSEGILLSTFPPDDKKLPEAHLKYAFKKRFDVFAHHIAKDDSNDNSKTLYLGIILHNPNSRPITIKLLQGASYLSQPDAKFIDLPPHINNYAGSIYAGPGDRTMNDLLRKKLQKGFPRRIIIPPLQSKMLINQPIPVNDLTPKLNGRSLLFKLESSGALYVASLAKYAVQENGFERAPTLAEWENLLNNGGFAGPAEPSATPPDNRKRYIDFGRVAGVAQGSLWKTTLTDEDSAYLAVPFEKGACLAYPLSTVDFGTMGTEQVQSASLLRRYLYSAYSAHGNYGIKYDLTFPLWNKTDEPQTLVFSLNTPVKEDFLTKNGLRFWQPPENNIFFWGTVRVRYRNEQGISKANYWHLVQRRGQKGEALLKMTLPPKAKKIVRIDFLYPPDATPPQVLMIDNLR